MRLAADGGEKDRDVAPAGGSIPTLKAGRAMDIGGGVTRGFPLKSVELSNFIRRLGATIPYSNAFIDLSVYKKCPNPSFFCLCSFRNGLLHDKFGLALT
ncbi:hypothetical protein [Burkholderia pyrrocinia]|uniref:hypothetical protein n=1 Tax=Burkholderia pyrrocinia TaxID=60550 RepID=UPI002AB040AA|nr:hypothetical protein [Burkholderia pyrrocinia]